ncbi:MAG: glycosyltransferase family 2 protein [Chitinispirillaceae bacterium]|jgi:GT2 family glycosyltransferase
MTNADSPRFSVVVPFYNNRAVAPESFPSIARLRGQGSSVDEIIAVDDCSTDGTADWIRENCPGVTLVANERNLGFGQTCRRGIERAANAWIILLNSDVTIISDIITPLVEDVQKYPDLFTVGFFSFDEKGGKFEGRKKIVPKTGLFKTRNNYSGEYVDGTLYDTFYACGGHALISREKFLRLNGFSPVFEPFYWEDADLSYRAMKRGWQVFFDPRCRVVHRHSGSIRSANREHFIKQIQTRNKMLFFWKNISSPLLWLRHATGMAVRLLTSWIAGDFIFYSAFGKALLKLPQVREERSKEKKEWRKNDRDLFRTGTTANMKESR